MNRKHQPLQHRDKRGSIDVLGSVLFCRARVEGGYDDLWSIGPFLPQKCVISGNFFYCKGPKTLILSTGTRRERKEIPLVHRLASGQYSTLILYLHMLVCSDQSVFVLVDNCILCTE